MSNVRSQNGVLPKGNRAAIGRIYEDHAHRDGYDRHPVINCIWPEPMPSKLSMKDWPTATFAAALLLATYCLFTIRTFFDPSTGGDIISLKRLLATGVGAAGFWLVATHLTRQLRSLRLWDLLFLSLAALAPVLASRLGYDLLTGKFSESSMMANVRWVIAWSGFFIAALLAYRVMLLEAAMAKVSHRPASVDGSVGLYAEFTYLEADPLSRLLKGE